MLVRGVAVSDETIRRWCANRGLRQETRRTGPPRPQPAPLRRPRPMGPLRAHDQSWRTRLLRPPPRRRRPAPPSPARPRKPARRHPARLPPPPQRLQREHRLGAPPHHPRRLTSYDPGMSTRRRRRARVIRISPERRARSSVAERPNIEISVVPFYGTHRLRMPGHSVTVTAWIEVAR
jgi:hypothetical protein